MASPEEFERVEIVVTRNGWVVAPKPDSETVERIEHCWVFTEWDRLTGFLEKRCVPEIARK